MEYRKADYQPRILLGRTQDKLTVLIFHLTFAATFCELMLEDQVKQEKRSSQVVKDCQDDHHHPPKEKKQPHINQLRHTLWLLANLHSSVKPACWSLILDSRVNDKKKTHQFFSKQRSMKEQTLYLLKCYFILFNDI